MAPLSSQGDLAASSVLLQSCAGWQTGGPGSQAAYFHNSNKPLLGKDGRTVVFADGDEEKRKSRKGVELAAIDTYACFNPPEVGRPFDSLRDACLRLYPFHALFEENFPVQSAPSQTSGAEKREATKEERNTFAELSDRNKWRLYVDHKIYSLFTQARLLQERFDRCSDAQASESLLDAYQLELLNFVREKSEAKKTSS